MPNKEAFAVAHIDSTQSPPAIVAVRIYSSDAGGITADQQRAFPVDIGRAEGVDFEDARAQVIAWLARYVPWAHSMYQREVKAAGIHITSVRIIAESIARGESARKATCTCGWAGPERATMTLAADDANQHESSAG